MPRGRPPTKDILTPREWQVLELLRQGLTNDQIAQRLGIGYDGAKFHVSEIITKLGVKSRYEASRWPTESLRGPRAMIPFLRPPIPAFAKAAFCTTCIVAGAVLLSALTIGLAGQSGQAALGQQVVVDWQVEELPPTTVRERSHPFRDNTRGVEDVWRGYVVRGGGQPQLVLESSRFLSTAPQWDESGQQVTFSFTSLADGASSSFNMIAGRLSVDLLDGQTREKILERGNVSPRGDMITNDWRGTPSPYTAVVYVHDEMGVARRLMVDGRDIRAASWSPNGLWILAKTFDGKCSNRADRTLYYVLAAGADHAMSLGSFCRGGPIWSPEGNRLAIYEGPDFAILDVVTGRQQRIPLGMALVNGPKWSPDGTLIVAGDGLIDAVAGQIIRPPTDPSYTIVSNDRQWLALATSPEVCGTKKPPLPPPPGDPAWESRNVRPADLNNGNRLVIQSVKDPDRHVVFDCDGSSYSAREWLPNNKLIVVGLGEGCGETICRPSPGAVWLVSPDGHKQQLTAGEESNYYQVSPDGGRILVGGTKLRMYSADGVLEREITPPPDRLVTGASWAPDGSSFAYTVRPVLQGLK